MELTVEIYRIVKFLPKEELFALSDQMRRAVASIPSNIAEGHGRGSDKDFLKFLIIARGSLRELDTQLEISRRLGFIIEKESKNAQMLIFEIGKMLNSLMAYLNKSINIQLSTRAAKSND